MIEVVQYIDRDGRDHFERWFERLDSGAQARIVIALDRVERGNLSIAKGVGGGVLELRLNFGPGYRVYFGRDGETLVILLCGGTKRRQQDDIAEARGFGSNTRIESGHRNGSDQGLQRNRQGATPTE